MLESIDPEDAAGRTADGEELRIRLLRGRHTGGQAWTSDGQRRDLHIPQGGSNLSEKGVRSN